MLRRVEKVLYKGVWTLLAASAGEPQLEILHQRPIEGPDEPPEIVYRTRAPVYIEPRWGYIITEQGVLIEDSFLLNFPISRAHWRLGVPSPFSFLQIKNGAKHKVVRHPRVISLRHFWEWNYYHFYIDVLGKLSLLAEIGLGCSIPLTVGRYVMDLSFPQQIIQMGNLRQRQWIIQDNFYVAADSVIFCRARQSYKQKMDFLMDEMGIPRNPPRDGARVFLTRGETSSRRILNMAEVQEVLDHYNFQVVDTAGMSIQEQIDLFAQTRHLIAIHGAGTTNMVFRREAPLSVLELYADNYKALDHELMGAEYGYTWDLLSGPPDGHDPQNANFTVAPELLEGKIRKMLNGEVN